MLCGCVKCNKVTLGRDETNLILISSTIKKNEIMPFAAATWMDLEIIILSQKEKDKYHMASLIWNLK